MKSVFAKVLLWCCGTLVFSFIAFFIISIVAMNTARPFERLHRMQLDDAIGAYRSGGPEQLTAYLGKLRSYLGGEYFFTDRAGRDLATGEDRSSLLSQAELRRRAPRKSGGKVLAGVESADSRYRLIVKLE